MDCTERRSRWSRLDLFTRTMVVVLMGVPPVVILGYAQLSVQMPGYIPGLLWGGAGVLALFLISRADRRRIQAALDAERESWR